ncbi:hypothetical protein O6H91_03G045000 [Diphasiastrum complanatum]|uniref:Uncharacterized protein n=1 Tax=Diphasiastrum complanatum TaxID=34168 RepID=A0ACC2E6G3_DIPCM|nr:hypothetical protein O6H91_03G045000 [Diphasiastrum complanatum]
MTNSVTIINLCFMFTVLAVTFASVNPPPIPSTPASTNAPFVVCDNSANFKSNSTYQKNLNTLLNALLADTPSRSELFKEHIAGSGPDTVYGFSQCFFTSLSQADCAQCIQRAVNQTSISCPSAIGAKIYYDECVAGYGNKNFSSVLIEVLVNTANFLADSPFKHSLDKVWSMLRQQVPLTQNPVAFEDGNEPDWVFAFSQCHNLSQSDCSGRIDSAISLPASSMGARIIYRDAFFRYENNDFFTGGVPFQVVASTQSPLGSVRTPSPSIRPSQKKSHGHVVILTTIIGGCTLLTICIFLVMIFITKKHPNVFRSGADHPSTKTEFFEGCPMFSYKALKEATQNFLKENKLGQGGFGAVYKGILYDGSVVAIKHLSRNSMQGNEEFLNEVAIITAIQHKNLVKLKGCCIEGEERLLVYEYLDHKSLDLNLFGTCVLNWKTRYNITVGIARGIDYLHAESEPRIVHRDIKASNVLLDIDFQPKLSDFGLARLFPEEQSFIATTTFAGTMGYLAPEATHGHLTEKVDVYSFGVLLLEIISGRKNQEIQLQIETLYIVDWAFQLCKEGRPLELVDPRLEGDYPENQARNLIIIAMSCVQRDPSLRPRMSNVVAMLLGHATVGSLMSIKND